MSEPSGNEDFMEKLAAYAAVRQEREESEAAEMFNKLSERERLLVKEAAVAGYVTAVMDSGMGHKYQIPKDRETLLRSLFTVKNFPDLYPTISEYREYSEEDDD